MSTASGHGAKTRPGSPRHEGLGGQLRVWAAKTLRWAANKLDPPKPGTPWRTDWDSTITTSNGSSYRLTFLP